MAFLRLVRNDFLLGKSEDVIEKLILFFSRIDKFAGA